MTHRLFPAVKITIVAFAFLLAGGQHASPAAAEQPLWNGAHALGVVRMAPLDRLKRDFAFLADGVNGGESAKAALDVLDDLSAGIDPRRPAGAVIYLFEGNYVPVIFLPLKDEQRLFATLNARFGWDFQRESDDRFRFKDANSELHMVARVAGSWIYVTGDSNSERLQDVPDDPTVLFEGSDPTLTAHATLNLHQFPDELRSQIGAKLTEAAADACGNSLGSEGAALAEPLVAWLFAETKSVQFELQCFRPLKQFHVTSRLQAVEGSRLERWIEDASQRPTRFSHLTSRDSIFAMTSSLQLDANVTRRLLQAWAPLAAKAKAAAPSPRSRDYAERLLGTFVERAVDAVTATIEPGQLDGGFVLERQGRDQVVLLAGTTLKGARGVDQAATDVGQLLQQAAEFRAMQWSVGQSGDVSIHRLNLPVDDAKTRALLGDPVVAAAGFGPDRLYAALGGDDALERLSEVVARSREDTPERGDVMRIHARVAPLLAALDAIPGDDSQSDAQLHELASQIAPYKRNDTLALSLTAADRALVGRLQVDMGIVRVLASQVPVTQAPVVPPADELRPGLLQLRPGERFQLVFHSKGKVATEIDGVDRLDLNTQSLTYDFHVVRVAADGTMHVEASLSRAMIEKTSPDGRTSFDSANPPPPDKLTPEMILFTAAVGQTVVLSLHADGTIAEISGIDEAIEKALDTTIQPPADERDQARAFVAQILNEPALRDSLTRGFDFYPGKEVSQGARWTRTTENLTQMNFLLDNRYQLKDLSADELKISVRSQVREPDAGDVQDQPIRWEMVGSQSGTIRLDPQQGRLRLATYKLRLDAEATFEVEGQTVARPIIAEFEMTIGTPRQVAGQVSAELPGRTGNSAAPIDLTGDVAKSKWRFSHPDDWQIDGDEIISRGGNYEKWSYAAYNAETFADFELTADVHYGSESNGGICIRATPGGLDGVNPSGYEVQLLGIKTDRNPTGSIYKMPEKGRVSSLYSAAPGYTQPNRWFSLRIVAQDTSLSVYINNRKVAACDDLQNPLPSGHIILQGSPQGTIRYRNVRIRPL